MCGLGHRGSVLRLPRRGRFVPALHLGDQALGARHPLGELLLGQSAKFARVGDAPPDPVVAARTTRTVTALGRPRTLRDGLDDLRLWRGP